MKTVFIINPYAGQGTDADMLISKLGSFYSTDTEIYITKSVGDATEYVKEYCKHHSPARFIACGGDGTFNEVLNGAIEVDGAEVGVIPIGTGNDFCRNFDTDIVASAVYGKSVKCDAIKYTIENPHGTTTGYCANMINIGFDCNVADMTAKMKTKPFISGSMAYLLSIFVALIGKKGASLKIETDGVERHFGKLLLTSVANGCYCGGGIKSNPLASVCDGEININIIKNVSRLKFLRLFPYYAKGHYLQLKNINKVILSEKCKCVDITPLNGNMRICIDGEITDAGKMHFEICPGAFSFALPATSDAVPVLV